MLPHDGVTTYMEDRQDDEPARFGAKENRIRKTPHPNAADVVVHQGETLRVFRCRSDSTFDLGYERAS